MNVKCILSNITIEDDCEVLAILLAQNKHEARPITLPFKARLASFGEVTIEDEFTLKYIKEMNSLGEFSHSFDKINIYNPYSGEKNNYFVKSNNPFNDNIRKYSPDTATNLVDDKTTIEVCVIKKSVYQKLIDNIPNKQYENTGKTYLEEQERIFDFYFENLETMKTVSEHFEVKKNTLSNYKEFYSIFGEEKHSEIKNLSTKLYDTENEANEFYAKAIMMYNTKAPLGELIDKTTTMELNADISNYFNNKLCFDNSPDTKKDILSFAVIAYSMVLLGLEFKTNNYVVDYDKNVIFKEYLKVLAQETNK